jgi:Ca2+-binding EF-hand superfamily protein
MTYRRLTAFALTAAAALAAPAMAAAQAPISTERLRLAFERLDANSDMVVDRAEVPEEALPAFNRLLARGDADKDGKLSAEEFRALALRAAPAAAAEPRARLEAMRERLRAMDRNNDGQVDKDEFQGPPGLFDRLDTNKDGAISRDDLRREAPPKP